MEQSRPAKERLNIGILPEEHKQIKIYAALHGKTITDYVLEVLRERLRQEAEARHLSAMTHFASPALKELWDNDKDSAYDRL